MIKRTRLSVLIALLLLITLGLLLTGCGCKHEWKDATCDAPKTCSKCSETEGEALGHKWADATCETAKTCSVCKKTEGDALGHKWADATCETAKTCDLCKKTEGDALGHKWADATCDAPKTCSLCKKTEGSALDHKWADATCDAPKTCSLCKKTEGSALGHKWVDADCETAKTCSVCKKVDGSPLGHKWIDATTEAPKTCSVCKKTEGTKIVTDPRFKTEACKDLFGTWTGIVRMTGTDMGLADFNGTLELSYTLKFGNDGSFSEVLALANKSAFTTELENYYITLMYAEFAKQGLTQAQADAAMKTTYGMDVKAYCKQTAATVIVNIEASYSNTNSGVYYVSGGKLYSGDSWTGTIGSDTYAIKDSTLSIATISSLFPNLVFTRVAN